MIGKIICQIKSPFLDIKIYLFIDGHRKAILINGHLEAMTAAFYKKENVSGKKRLGPIMTSRTHTLPSARKESALHGPVACHHDTLHVHTTTTNQRIQHCIY